MSIQVGPTDIQTCMDVFRSADVTALVIDMDPIDFGVPETRGRKLVPFYRHNAEASIDVCTEALYKVKNMLDKMKSCPTPISLADCLYANEHPLVVSWEAGLMPSSKTERVINRSAKKLKREVSGEGFDEILLDTQPGWWADHALAYTKRLNQTWVHPSRNSKLLDWTLGKRSVQALPWREKDLAYLFHLLHPHPGDALSTEEALAKYDEQTLEVSQEYQRCDWKVGLIQCLTKNSVILLRFRRRVMHGSEKMRCHGFFAANGALAWQVYPHSKQTELAGLGFNGFIVAALHLAMQVHMPKGVFDAILLKYGV